MFQEGQQIGLYTLIERIGQGGFGEVWLAENQANSPIQKVAIKLPLHNQIDLNAVKDEIFNWTVSGRHKNILPIIECEVFDNQIAIVSEFAPDGSLKDLLNKKGCLPISDAVEIVIGVLNGLAHLHKRKIIHRDLKPDNILFQGKIPRLTDFGISRALPQNSLSQLIAGTASYMAVESFAGTRNEKTDIFSVGVILYQALTNKLPFLYRKEIMKAVITENETLLRQYKDEIPQSLPNKIPSDLQDIIIKSLAKEPGKRYQTADEMYQELKTFEADFIRQVNINSDDSILFQNSSIDSILTPAPTEASPTQPSPTADKEISPAEEQSTLTKLKFLQDKERKEDAGKQPLITTEYNKLAQSETASIESSSQISSAPTDVNKRENISTEENENKRLRARFDELIDELEELVVLNTDDGVIDVTVSDYLEEAACYGISEELIHSIEQNVIWARDFPRRIKSLKPQADKLGILVPEISLLNARVVKEFENKVFKAINSRLLDSSKESQIESERSVDNGNPEVGKQQKEETPKSKRTEFLERLKIANEKAQKVGAHTIVQSSLNEKSNKEIEEILKHFEDSIREEEKNLSEKASKLLTRVSSIEKDALKFKIPLPDKLNLTEKVVSDFEKQVAAANENERKSENPKTQKVNNIGSTASTIPPHDYKETIRLIILTPVMLSGIIFVFWYFEPLRSLFPSKCLGLWVILMILGLATSAAKDEEVPIIIKFIGVNLVYFIGLGLLFGANYLANPNKTIKVYDETIKILGLKRGSTQQTFPLDTNYPLNRQNKIQFPGNFPNFNVNTEMNASPNANTQANVSLNTNTQSNLQSKNSNTPIILGKTPSVSSLSKQIDEQNANVKKSINGELEKNGLKSPFNNVNVEVTFLEIKLSGIVKDLNSKKQAIDIANQKKGYRSVDSNGLLIFKPQG